MLLLENTRIEIIKTGLVESVQSNKTGKCAEAAESSTEVELLKTVEYDMDDLDKKYLELVRPTMDYDMFEYLMDSIEKEWFELVKDLPKNESDVEIDGKCCICDESECDNSNAIVFCDGCNIAVHQECYGIPYIPEGQWLCRKCLTQDKHVKCNLCPSLDGALKQTTDNKWCHVLCSLWVPEATVTNLIYMEPIDILSIPKSRYKLVCYICGKKEGACIQCDCKNCYASYHPTGYRISNFLMKMKKNSDTICFRSHCDKHTPKDHVGAVSVSYAKQLVCKQRKLSNNLREQVQPIVTQSILKSLEKKLPRQFSYMKPGKETREIILTVCKYWSMKKELKGGAPLLKRLHIEPWTASTSLLQQTEEERAERFKTMLILRNDLERVRVMLDLVKRREKEKVKRLKLMKQATDLFFNPLKYYLQSGLETLKKSDKYLIFAEPVNTELVTDYASVISQPMDFSTMSAKVNENVYRSLEEFEKDARLILSNCLIYNKPDTIYAKQAKRIEKTLDSVMETLKTMLANTPIHESNRLLASIDSLFEEEKLTFPSAGNFSESDASRPQVEQAETSLIQIDSITPPPAPLQIPFTVPTPRRSSVRISRRLSTPLPNLFFPSTVVWAKIPGISHYPGIIHEASDAPPALLRLSRSRHSHLVEFFDKMQGKRSWNWVEENKLVLLGKNKSADMVFLREKKIKKGREGMVRAYKWACEAMGVKEEDVDAVVIEVMNDKVI